MRVVLISVVASVSLTACASFKPPEIAYDAVLPPAAPAPIAVVGDPGPRPLHRPPVITPARGGAPGQAEARAPLDRVEHANAAARIEPKRAGYYNAVQVYSYSPGALYQVYAAPGKVTDVALQPGERLAGAGPIAAGDTARWIIGDTESGAGELSRVHILVKPTRPDIDTNLVINTDRRTYHLELRADEDSYMPSVAWYYPEDRSSRTRRTAASAGPALPNMAYARFRYALQGDTPPWRPVSVFDDGRKVYIQFPRGIAQGELPPLFVIGADGGTELVNYRTYRNLYIVDRLFAAAELRLGGKDQQVVRIVRTDGRPRS